MDKTLIKGVQLLELLVQADGPCGVAELARASGWQPSNVHRTLQTWSQLGFIVQDADSGAYRCTLRLFEWGCRVADQLDLRRLARPHLVALAERTQETIHLSQLVGADVVYLDKIDSAQPVRAYSEIGGRAPAHCVATGKALLACAPAPALEQLPSPLPRPTIHSVPDRAALQAQFTRIRAAGYAVNHEEWRIGVRGLGAAIFDHQARAVAAVGLSAPAGRLPAVREKALGALVAAAAQAVTVALGGSASAGKPARRPAHTSRPAIRAAPMPASPLSASLNVTR